MRYLWRFLNQCVEQRSPDSGGESRTTLRRGPLQRSTRPPEPCPLELIYGWLRAVPRVFRRLFQDQPKGPPPPLPPSELDEYGFPRVWRRDSPNEKFLAHSAEYWPYFERWCETRGLQAFPASVEVVLKFLRNPPLQGRDLYEVWRAINARHEAYYWHTDANPVQWLKVAGGVQVTPHGWVEMPEFVKHIFKEKYDWW